MEAKYIKALEEKTAEIKQLIMEKEAAETIVQQLHMNVTTQEMGMDEDDIDPNGAMPQFWYTGSSL